MGAKICCICGKEFKGMGHPCKDGDYCGDCEKKVTRVFPGEDAYYETSAAIRAKLEKYADEIAAYDSVPRPETCPICGKKLPKLMSMRLLDAYICMNCAEKASGLMHQSYDAIGCMCLGEILPFFSKAAVQGGKTDSGGVFHDADSLRVLYPLIRTLRETPGEDGYDVDYIDPLDSLSEEELRSAPERAELRRSYLRQQYGDHKAIFEVDAVTKLYNTSKGRRFYRDEYRIGGRVLLGDVALRDTAVVRRGEQPRELQIRKLGDSREYISNLKELKEGSEGGLFAEGVLSFVYPGDILCID